MSAQHTPVRAVDVAAAIQERMGEMTAMKLQKLVYYSQAWSLVWDEAPLISEQVQAWANGPVIPELYTAHRGLYTVAPGQIEGNPGKLDKDQIETIEAVLQHYGDKHSQWLSDLTHAEDPWKNARQQAGLTDGARGSVEISQAAMAEYYSSL
jgi:uncharacterized phage-associated protein